MVTRMMQAECLLVASSGAEEDMQPRERTSSDPDKATARRPLILHTGDGLSCGENGCPPLVRPVAISPGLLNRKVRAGELSGAAVYGKNTYEIEMAKQIHLLTFPLPGMAGAMAQMFETAGWDGVYFADTQNLAGDVFVSLGLAAAATEKMTLATGVTNPVTRHPAVTASAIATVQVASGGRAVLGIGRGDSSLGFLGRKPARVAEFEAFLVRLRAFLHGEEADLGDAKSRNQWIADSDLPPVPIDVAATGPKVTAIAARHADAGDACRRCRPRAPSRVDRIGARRA